MIKATAHHAKTTLHDLAQLYQATKPTANHLHAELPYRFVDPSNQCFDNQGSVGFGVKLAPLAGANDDLIRSLHAIITHLPEGSSWDFQVVLTGTPQVHHLIAEHNQSMAKRGGIAARFADHQAVYARYAAQHGFATAQDATHCYDLKDYQVTLFCSTTGSKDELLLMRRALLPALRQSYLSPQLMDAQDFIDHVRLMLNYDHHQTAPLARHYNPLEPLNTQILASDSAFLIQGGYIDSRVPADITALHSQDIYTAEHKPPITRIVNLGLQQLPSELRLYGLPNALASLDEPAHSLRCPFRWSVNFRIEPTGRETTRNASKIQALSKWLRSPMAWLLPTGSEELQEREVLQKQLLGEQCKVASMVMTLTLFTTPEHHHDHTLAAINTFRKAGLSIQVTKQLQAQTLLAALPFQMANGWMTDCRRAGRVRTVKTTHLVNFLPLIAEQKTAPQGMLLPTMRHQIAWFDPFHCGTDNTNIALTGTSGSGKSFFTQLLALSIWSRPGKVWILDKGESYKKLTRMLGGVYMHSQRIFLNPFTHLQAIAQQARYQSDHHTNVESASQPHDVSNNTNDNHTDDTSLDPIAEALGDITSLIAVMAAPNTDLDDYRLAMLGDAIVQAWQAKGGATCIDDVQRALYQLAEKRHNDRSLSDLAAQLNKYCTTGIYGDVFNKPSDLNPNIDITTLELDGFSEDVLRPVVFALMVAINQQMYLAGDRDLPKLCIIEEAWSLMAGSNAQSRRFIEKGYRTARKFGGSFMAVTQGIEDFTASSEAQAAFNNADIHITLRQGKGFEAFLQAKPNHFSPFEQAMIRQFPTAQLAGYSCVLIKAGNQSRFHRLFADPWTRALLSTDAKEFAYCEQLLAQGIPLEQAVEQTAWQFYPDAMRDFAAMQQADQFEQVATDSLDKKRDAA
jgi:conjugal transfer ATP-binding protein TraC